MIEAIGLRLAGYPDIPAADLRLVNGRIYGIFDTGDGAASALLATLAGAELPLSGTVKIGGFDTVREPAAAGRGIGYTSSDAAFYGRMTVWELMLFVSEVRGEGGSQAARDIHAVLDDLDLDDVRNVMLCRLSTDRLRRVGLAQALAGNPGTLFLDRPTKGLKPGDAAALREDIRHAAEGRTVFLAGDNASELSALCDRFLFVDGCGVTPPLEREALTEQTATPALAAFLGLRNMAKGTPEEEERNV